MSGCEIAPPPDLDFSKMAYPGTLKVYPDWEKAVKIVLGVLVELVALVGNALVIVIVVKYKSMRTTTNYYLVNLAISDLLVASIPIWIHVVASLNEFWVFGSFLCKFSPFMQITAMCANMFTLVVIAWDRFFAIMFPMKSRVTRRKVSYVLVVVWIAAIAIAIPLLFMFHYEERHWKDAFERYCAEKWPMKTMADGDCDMGLGAKKAYWIVVCAVLNWTLMICTIVAYGFIVVRLSKNKIVPKLGASAKSSIQERSKKRVVLMMFLILLVFIICAAPFQTIRIYFLFTQDRAGYKLPEWYPTLDFAFVLLMYSNAAVNPIIYGGLNESFRCRLKDLIDGVIHRHSPNASEEFETEYKNRSTLRSVATTDTYLTNGRNGTSSVSRGVYPRTDTQETAVENGNMETIAEVADMQSSKL